MNDASSATFIRKDKLLKKLKLTKVRICESVLKDISVEYIAIFHISYAIIFVQLKEIISSKTNCMMMMKSLSISQITTKKKPNIHQKKNLLLKNQTKSVTQTELLPQVKRVKKMKVIILVLCIFEKYDCDKLIKY